MQQVHSGRLCSVFLEENCSRKASSSAEPAAGAVDSWGAPALQLRPSMAMQAAAKTSTKKRAMVAK
eukprot:CAMPEP_0113821796 /NCGR_PEP_ID=MMETSP0328-20130328/1919_1 /TAXON_ID=39455 /ORGANISM="Alexandrium minutum" /LENGTH=65 /DNA_ID=CAMNT_0000789731 /DNA_START=346 /DNA_END=543 /DNA_ORIENTATION=+ /assembly_acc=CAM_ASM_000350